MIHGNTGGGSPSATNAGRARHTPKRHLHHKKWGPLGWSRTLEQREKALHGAAAGAPLDGGLLPTGGVREHGCAISICVFGSKTWASVVG